MDLLEARWLGQENRFSKPAILCGVVGTVADFIRSIEYPNNRQNVIDVIGPVGNYLGNFGLSYLSALVGTLILPSFVLKAIQFAPEHMQENLHRTITPERSAFIFGILAPMAGNIIAEHGIFDRMFLEHTGDVAMGALGIGLGVLSSRVIHTTLNDLSETIWEKYFLSESHQTNQRAYK